jgi:hypothetical protein
VTTRATVCGTPVSTSYEMVPDSAATS